MLMFHGTTHYAVYGRSVGTFGGRDKNATIKVYDGSNMARPQLTISGALVATVHQRLCMIRKDRAAVQAYLDGAMHATAYI
jgi:hypothetical protein